MLSSVLNMHILLRDSVKTVVASKAPSVPLHLALPLRPRERSARTSVAEPARGVGLQRTVEARIAFVADLLNSSLLQQWLL